MIIRKLAVRPRERGNLFVRRRKSESGQAALLIVVAMAVFVIGALGLAIDGSMLYGHRQMAQAAADAAAQSGIDSIFHGTNATASNPFATGTPPAPYSCTTTDGTTPCVYARLNGFGGSADDTVSISFPTSVPGVSLSAGNASAMTVQVQRTVNPALMGILGFRTFSVAASSTAALVKFPISNCVTALDMTASGTFSISGNGVVTLTRCGLAVDSSSPSALQANGNNARLTASAISVVGGVDDQHHDVSPTPITGAPLVADPLSAVPAPSYNPLHCDFTNESVTGTATLTQGVYCGGISLSGHANVTFSAGTYILLGGGLNVARQATATGSNLTFYNTFDATHAYSPVSLTGNGNITLSATTGGALTGMLFFEDRNAPLGNTQVFAGNGAATLTGSLYFPRSTVSYSGNSWASYQNVAVVADKALFSGNGTALLNVDPTVAGAPQQTRVAMVQ